MVLGLGRLAREVGRERRAHFAAGMGFGLLGLRG